MVVVEAGGNGSMNLDDPFYNNAFQRSSRCFGGTSSASPIVAGAVTHINGNRKARFLPPLNSTQMRSLLASTGWPQGTTPPGQPFRNIGPQPNLRAAITSPSNR